MNRTEKLICILLALGLAWYLWDSTSKAKAEAARRAEAAAIAATNAAPAVAEAAKPSVVAEAKAAAPAEVKPAAAKPSVPERTVVLENDDVKLELTTWGAAVKTVTLKKYAKERGAVSAENPAVTLDFSEAPLGSDEVLEAFEVVSSDAQSVTFGNGKASRTVTLDADYQIVFRDAGYAPKTLSLGTMRMGDSKNDLLSVDSFALDAGKGKPGVLHHCEGDSPLKAYLVGGLSGGCSGCSGTRSAASWPAESVVSMPGAQSWIAAKNRFFVTALANCSAPNRGFETTIRRDTKATGYRPERLTVRAQLAESSADTCTTTFYVGPKKQSLLWNLGMRDVMEFGMWRWICYPLVWVLNFFNNWIPNYGVAIILLTILVRILFWPLTHKSTVGMKKMQEIQPKMKEIQKKFKDNPQRLQQETWALYKAEKVNPMSSCLPMLIQIPVFIALFNVLRSAVELRYAPFLWIGDLSEPEGLFAAYLPFGGLNLLPILMAVTTGLQSAFTPSTGDKSQQKMMMIFMPVMMLFMFYSFPSALSLYWFLSNLFSIGQMWLIRRQTAKEQAANGVVVPDEIIDPPQTRQMRRHG